MKKSKSMLFFRAVVAILFILALFAPVQNRMLIPGIIVFGLLGAVLLFLLPKMTLPKFSLPMTRTTKYQEVLKNQEDTVRLALLCQLSHRITEKLRSAFPDATWDWEHRPDLEQILNGKSVRLCVYHAGEFSHAEMLLDTHGSLQLQMLLVEKLHAPSKGASASPADTRPATVNCSSWYELVGAPVLTNLITDLNARGYSSLSINDKGDLFIVEDGSPVVKDTFENFPGKACFDELATIFEENELQVNTTDQALILTWNV